MRAHAVRRQPAVIREFIQRVPFDASWKLAEHPAIGWSFPNYQDSGWKPVEVSTGQPWGGNRNTEHALPPAPYLRTAFEVPGDARHKAIRRATLYATALGVYTCWINGLRVGTDELTPGWTEYAKRVEHQTYDVTAWGSWLLNLAVLQVWQSRSLNRKSAEAAAV